MDAAFSVSMTFQHCREGERESDPDRFPLLLVYFHIFKKSFCLLTLKAFSELERKGCHKIYTVKHSWIINFQRAELSAEFQLHISIK